MTAPDNADFQLQQRIQAGRSYSAQGGPGSYFYWFLSRHITAADVLFADVGPDTDRSEYNAQTGRLFVVTARALWQADYTGAADEDDGDPQQDFGTVDLLVMERKEPVELRWAGRSLRIPKDRLTGTSRGIPLQRGALTLAVGRWSIDLPLERADDGDGYVSKLMAALTI